MPRTRINRRDDELHIDLRSTPTKPDTVCLSKNLRQLHARGTHVPTPGKGAGVSVVKVKIMPSSRAAGYCAYMERDDKDAELLTAEGRALDTEAFIDRSRRDPHIFAVTVSPAGAKDLNLERDTERFLQQMQDDLGSQGEDTGRFNVERLTLKAVGDTNGYGGPFELHILMEHAHMARTSFTLVGS
jgi:hypothetical protein